MYEREIPLDYAIPFRVGGTNYTEQLEVVALLFENEAPDLFFFNDHFEFYAFMQKSGRYLVLGSAKVGSDRLRPVGVFSDYQNVCDFMRATDSKTPQMSEPEKKTCSGNIDISSVIGEHGHCRDCGRVLHKKDSGNLHNIPSV